MYEQIVLTMDEWFIFEKLPPHYKSSDFGKNNLENVLDWKG